MTMYPVPNTDNIPRRPADSIFPGRIEAIKAHTCMTCGATVEQFRNALSQKEYLISGVCQKCQDEVFR